MKRGTGDRKREEGMGRQECKSANRPEDGAKVRVQSTDFRFQKSKGTHFPFPLSVAFG
jgi:hypothetical protein